MSPPPPLSIGHTVRVSALEPEKTWRLSGDTLWICAEGKEDMPIPLTGIRKLRLSYDPSRFQRGLFRCHLYNADGTFVTIQNGHYKGFADFEERTETYLPFVHALISRLV
jgi:hypothetical protein